MWCELCAEREAVRPLQGLWDKPVRHIWAWACSKCAWRNQGVNLRVGLRGTARKAMLPRLRHRFCWRGFHPWNVPPWDFQPRLPTCPRHGRSRWIARVLSRWPLAVRQLVLAGLK